MIEKYGDEDESSERFRRGLEKLTDYDLELKYEKYHPGKFCKVHSHYKSKNDEWKI